MSMKKRPDLIIPSTAYKPFRYPWAIEAWREQSQIHWLPEELNLGDDIKDWSQRLTDDERSFLTHIFRFFTQADVDVAGGYIDHFLPFFKPSEVRMMLLAFGNMETVHITAYALLIETLGMPDSEFQEFMQYKEMVDKHEYLSSFKMTSPKDVLKTLAVFAAFTEGLQLFASFAMLLNFPRTGKMKGMGQVVTWSIRDESLHCASMIRLFHEYAEQSGAYDASVKKEIRQIAKDVVDLEDRFIDSSFKNFKLEGITAPEMKQYIRYIADHRLKQLNLEPIFGVSVYPLPWLFDMLNGVEHANFFEVRPTEYAKAATSSSWAETWAKVDGGTPLNE